MSTFNGYEFFNDKGVLVGGAASTMHVNHKAQKKANELFEIITVRWAPPIKQHHSTVKPYHYVVLIEGKETRPRQFPNHADAFEYCSALPDKTKGVYKIIDVNTLGALNVSGTNEDVYAMQQNSNYNFKVI